MSGRLTLRGRQCGAKCVSSFVPGLYGKRRDQMAKKCGQLGLVSSQDPGSGVDDFEALRRAQAAPAGSTFQGRHRQRIAETFARIPHDRGFALGRRNLSGAAWALLIVLDRLILEGRGRNPVKLTYRYRKAAGLSRYMTKRGLQQLEAASVISIERQPGQAPLVTHLWFPVS